jgi:RNA polymerase sigma-70 factor, ECF subfamily
VRTDAELVAAARTDAGAFRELYDRYAPAIHRFHLGRSRDADASLDLTAETFAQAWLSRERFRDLAGGSAGPWLYAIARHVLVSSVRKRQLERRACERLGVLLEREAPVDPDDRWLDGFDEALAELSPDVQEAIRLRIVDDLPYTEVARSAGTTPGAARVRVHRGLGVLRQRLARTKEAPE